jgi:small subunit ribosomal protein S14
MVCLALCDVIAVTRMVGIFSNMMRAKALLAQLPKIDLDFYNLEQVLHMAKKSSIEREKKRERLVAKYADKREALLEEFKAATTPQLRFAIHRKIQQLPRNSAPTRLHNRCWVTGRPRGYYRDFGLSRNVLREWAHAGLLPGVVKSSW